MAFICFRTDNRFRKMAEMHRQRAQNRDHVSLRLKGLALYPEVVLTSVIGLASGLRPRKRLSQSAAVLNRSSGLNGLNRQNRLSGLRRVIYIHRGGPKGHECMV